MSTQTVLDAYGNAIIPIPTPNYDNEPPVTAKASKGKKKIVETDDEEEGDDVDACASADEANEAAADEEDEEKYTAEDRKMLAADDESVEFSSSNYSDSPSSSSSSSSEEDDDEEEEGEEEKKDKGGGKKANGKEETSPPMDEQKLRNRSKCKLCLAEHISNDHPSEEGDNIAWNSCLICLASHAHGHGQMVITSEMVWRPVSAGTRATIEECFNSFHGCRKCEAYYILLHPSKFHKGEEDEDDEEDVQKAAEVSLAVFRHHVLNHPKAKAAAVPVLPDKMPQKKKRKKSKHQMKKEKRLRKKKAKLLKEARRLERYTQKVKHRHVKREDEEEDEEEEEERDCGAEADVENDTEAVKPKRKAAEVALPRIQQRIAADEEEMAKRAKKHEDETQNVSGKITSIVDLLSSNKPAAKSSLGTSPTKTMNGASPPKTLRDLLD